MSGQRGGWPILLADLALILFVATALQAAHSAATQGSDAARPPEPGVPQAFYLAGSDAPPFAEWIAAQGQGVSAQVTILATYRPGGADAALISARALAREADTAGTPPRIIVEPGDGQTRAILAYDDAEG